MKILRASMLSSMILMHERDTITVQNFGFAKTVGIISILKLREFYNTTAATTNPTKNTTTPSAIRPRSKRTYAGETNTSVTRNSGIDEGRSKASPERYAQANAERCDEQQIYTEHNAQCERLHAAYPCCASSAARFALAFPHCTNT